MQATCISTYLSFAITNAGVLLRLNAPLTLYKWLLTKILYLGKMVKCYSICTYAGETEVNCDPCWFRQYVEGRPLALIG